MVLASVSACSKLAPGWSRTAARQTSPSMSSPRGLASTRWRMPARSSACRSSGSWSRSIRRSSMFAPRQHDSRGKHRRPDDLSGSVERLADPHRNDGLSLGFIQVTGSPAQLLLQGGPELSRRQHQRLDRIGGLFRGAMREPAPGAVLALAVPQPAKGLQTGVGCRRGEREDGVGGGIEGGTMPLVDPMIAVYARITQVLDDFLLNHMLAGEGLNDLEDFEDVRIGGNGRIPLEGEGKEEVHAFERPERARRDREPVAVQDAEGERGIVRVSPQALPGYAHPVVRQRLGQVAQQRRRFSGAVVGPGEVVEHPGHLEHLERCDLGNAAAPAVAEQQGYVLVRLLVARLEQEIGGR